jgi:hypothetical protein
VRNDDQEDSGDAHFSQGGRPLLAPARQCGIRIVVVLSELASKQDLSNTGRDLLAEIAE